MRGGLWSGFSVPGAGVFTRFDPYCDGAQVVSGCVNVGRWLPQNSPACNCWAAVSPVKSTGVHADGGGAQVVGGCRKGGDWLPQTSPACNCWSAVSPVKSPGVVVSVA